MSDLKSLANAMFPSQKTPADIFALYPPRKLPEGAEVTRFSPSPTGIMHLGNVYATFISERFAHQSGGIFYLRIEDTDKKREVKGGVSLIVKALEDFNIKFDEGFDINQNSYGNYGPYRQSDRVEIYHVFAKYLCEKGLCYPCFCSEEDLKASHEEQESQKLRGGYYSKWAKCRNLSIDESIERIKKGDSYVVRLKSLGSESNKIVMNDVLRNKIELPQNDLDIVLLKSNGIPTYHFAHAVDDYLMGTTLVVRGDEWMSSYPIHQQLFEYLDFKLPKYLHLSPLMKMDGQSKRKFSKRKDPEFAADYYNAAGYDPDCVKEYMATLFNSDYEQWKKQNKDKTFRDFKFSPKKMSISGALFDLMKLNDVAKNIICRYTSEEVYEKTLKWAEKYDTGFYNLMVNNKDICLRFLSIDRYNQNPRKDITKWSDVKEYMSYIFPSLYSNDLSQLPDNIDKTLCKKVISEYIGMYDETADNSQWFNTLKDLSEKTGFAREVKDYKQNPDNYPGHVGDVSTIIRVCITGKKNSPDLCEIMKLIGKDEVINRLSYALNSI